MAHRFPTHPCLCCYYNLRLQRVTDALAGHEENNRVWTAPSEEDPTYRLLVDCNQLAVDIDNEIGIIHNFMRDKYRLKFPELESLVHHPIDYARVVQAIGTCIASGHCRHKPCPILLCWAQHTLISFSTLVVHRLVPVLLGAQCVHSSTPEDTQHIYSLRCPCALQQSSL